MAHHFYNISPVTPDHYAMVEITGYVLKSNDPGTVPLYRF